MKNSKIVSASGGAIAVRPIYPGCFAALLAGLVWVSGPVAIGRAQPTGSDADGAEVLTRGPVHEAFAGMISFNPEAGIVVPAPPPEPIEELPPEERPEGDDVAWIPGYWGWDDERNDYLWISGTWRVMPPGREWVAGYWRDTGRGYQWISGYWADAAQQDAYYLPPPPETLETGPNVDPPSPDYEWTPGCWVWSDGRYAWRAGYWMEGRADWVWIPAGYIWTPRGVLFLDGFWDYPVERRGVLFAPVYYRSHRPVRRGYSYSPQIVISLSVFTDCLFLRPSYHHYYFGDYYDSRYDQDGFYASFSYQSGRQGYDPFYSRARWEHRGERDWDNRFQASYDYRRKNEAARPPRTWSVQLSLGTGAVTGSQARIALGSPLQQLATRRDNPVRFQPVAQRDRDQLAQRGRDVQQSREQRRTVEAQPAITTGRNPGEAAAPVKVPAQRSPLAARPAGQRGRNAAPPEAPRAPRPDPNVPPRAENRDRRPNADARSSAPDTRPAEPARQASRDQHGAVIGEKPAQPAIERRPNGPAASGQDESQRRAQQAQADAVKARQEHEQQARADAVQAQQESQRNGQPAQRKAQQDEERRNRESNTAARAKQEGEQRAQADAVKARQEAQQREQESQRKEQQAQRQTQEAQTRAQQDEQRAKASEESQQQASQAAARAKQEAEQHAQADAAKAGESRRQAPPQVRAPEGPRRDNDGARAKPAPEPRPTKEEEDAGKEKDDEKRRGG